MDKTVTSAVCIGAGAQCRYLQTLAEVGLGCVRGRLPFLEPEIRDVAKGTNGWTADVR